MDEQNQTPENTVNNNGTVPPPPPAPQPQPPQTASPQVVMGSFDDQNATLANKTAKKPRKVLVILGILAFYLLLTLSPLIPGYTKYAEPDNSGSYTVNSVQAPDSCIDSTTTRDNTWGAPLSYSFEFRVNTTFDCPDGFGTGHSNVELTISPRTSNFALIGLGVNIAIALILTAITYLVIRKKIYK